MISRILSILGITATVWLLAACGGSSSPGDTVASPSSTTGTVGILFTDGPTDEFDRILITVNEVSLLPADEDAAPVEIFSGEETFDLLELRDFTDFFAVAEDVPAGDYRKVRMRISNIDLVALDDLGEVDRTVQSRITGNGKLDLNPRSGGPITLEGGETLLIRLDLDAEKSFLVVRAGASGQYIFRPVVFVDIEGERRDRLVRLFGTIGEIEASESRFELCELQRIQGEGTAWSGCVMIRTDVDTGLFGADGLPIAFSTLETGETATAIGFFVGERINDLRVLDALVVQYGPRLDSGTSASRYSGFTTTSIDGNGRFNLRLDPSGQGLAEGTLDIALQGGAALITREGERLQPTEIGVGAEVITEGILIGDELRASLLVVNMDGDAEQVLEGVLVGVNERVLTITVELAGDRCVRVAEDADITRIVPGDEDGTVTETITLEDLVTGDLIEAFGLPAFDGCFDATSIIVDETAVENDND